jgi:RND family efflux transporter MFP subunit
MRLKNKIIVLVAVAAVAAGSWFGYLQILPQAKVARVVRGKAVHLVPANVTVTAEYPMEIKCDLGGRIAKANVKLGQEVKAGEVLFEVDSQDLQIEISQIETDKKAVEARIALGSPLRFEIATAEENLKNSKRMFETGRLAQVEYDRATRNVDILKDRKANEDIDNQKTKETFENTLRLKRRSLEKMKLLVPEDGTIVFIDDNGRTGGLVGGGTVLARVISRSRLVVAQISEENFAGVRPGLPVRVQFLGYYGQWFKGKVERVLPTSDEKTKRYTAFLSLDIPVEQLVPGLTGDAGITVNERENALLVPRRSVVGVENSKLWVVQDGRVRYTSVSLGFLGQNVAEILGGVKEGDQVIVEELSMFKNGQRVRVVEDAGSN